MQENNFEKEVRQKMEALQFTPSEPVWQKVEWQIRRIRARRRLLLLMLPLLLVGSGLTWYFVAHNEPAVSAPATVAQKELPAPSTPPANGKQTISREVEPQEQTAIINKTHPAPSVEQQNGTTRLLQKEKQTFSVQAPVLAENEEDEAATVSALPAIPKRKNNVLPEDMHALVLEQEIARADLAQKDNADKKPSDPFKDSSGKEAEPAMPVAQQPKQSVITADSLATVQPAINKADTAAMVVAQPLAANSMEQKKKWSFTAHARLGASGIRHQVVQVFSQERSPVFSSDPSPWPSAGSGSSGGNNSAPGFGNSLTLENGAAFSAGAGVRRHLFKNTFVVAGLQYSQYTSRTNVSMRHRIDTIVSYNGRMSNISGYYRGGTATRYTARYHYLELPLAFEYRVFKNVPLQVQHGISTGYLLSSNALYYNRGAGILYASDEWLRKWGVQLFTSLDYRLLRAGRLHWFAGPQLQWGLLPLQQKSEPQQQHLFFTGLQTRITF